MTLPRILIVTAIVALPISIPFVSQPSVSVESCKMSDQSQTTLNFLAWMDDQIVRQRRAGVTSGNVLNINALDDLDPVHDRATQNPEREFDHDGDMGREHDDHLRDNGAGRRGGGTYGPAWTQIADALPVIEAPSIAAELPAGEPVKTESEG